MQPQPTLFFGEAQRQQRMCNQNLDCFFGCGAEMGISSADYFWVYC